MTVSARLPDGDGRDPCAGARASARAVARVVVAVRVAPIAFVAFVAGVAGVGAAAAEASGPIPAVTIEQPERAFGRTIGDVLAQRVVVGEDIDIDVSAIAETLPAGRIDAWFERLPVRVVERPRGRRALELRYQIVNAPDEAVTVRLPPLALALADGVAADVPEWPVGLVALIPREIVGEGDLLALRPDRRLPPFETAGRRARLVATALALASTVLAWFGWWAWRRRSDRKRLPFARARHAMRALPSTARDQAPESWRALHRALDDTAGGTVHRGSLDRLLELAPWLAPSGPAIERFYAASAARFFAEPARAEPFPVGELVGELYRAEKRNAG